MARIEWKAGQIHADAAAAATVALDRTMALAVEHAKADHPGFPPASEPYERYANRTGFQTGSLAILEDAKPKAPDSVAGQWGSESRYALYLEIGTSVTGPTAEQRALAADGNMSLVSPPIGPLMAPRPYLRPAADVEYPQLARRMGEAFRGESMV